MAAEVQDPSGGTYDLRYDVVWCPKYRRPVLAGEIGRRCEELIRARCDERDWPVVALDIAPDHVHLSVKAHPSDSPAHVAHQLKGFTSRVLRQEFPSLRSRLPTLWSRSFFVATVGTVSAVAVRRYLESQYERPWRKEQAS